MVRRTAGVTSAVALLAVGAFAPTAAQSAPAGPPTKQKAAKVKPGKLLTRSATTTTTTDGQLASALATCPARAKAVSGGFATTFFASGGNVSDLQEVYESRRLGANSWRVSAARDSANPSGPALTITAFVYCRKGWGKIPEAAWSILIGGGAGVRGSATANCPGAKKAISGGFAYNPPVYGIATENPAQHYESYRSAPRSWTATLHNLGASSRTLTSYAYCRAGKAPSEKSASTAVPNGGGLATKLSSPACTGKRTALGGGYRTNPPTGTTLAPLVIGSALAGKAWEVSATSKLGSGTIRSSVYCG